MKVPDSSHVPARASTLRFMAAVRDFHSNNLSEVERLGLVREF